MIIENVTAHRIVSHSLLPRPVFPVGLPSGRMCVALKSGRVDVRGPSWIDNVQERIFFVGETQMFWDEGPQPKIISKTVIGASFPVLLHTRTHSWKPWSLVSSSPYEY